MTSTLRFLGATGTVTGSRFLVERDGTRVLVDCGLYQGLRELRRRNWADFPVDPASIDSVVLTHAHLDHCGYLPALVRHGFAGPVFATPDTAELAGIVLRDSAHLQEEDAQYARTAGYSKHAPPLPLYDRDDAERAIERLTPVDFGSALDVAPGAQVLLRPAGHILGSATAELVIGERRILFTGDLGRAGHPLLRPPEVPGAVDVVVSESTYGDRLHESSERGTAVLADTLRRTLGRGGVVLVPAFAVDRTEVVLHAIARLMRAGDVPQTPVHVDSPMAIAALDVYRRAIRERHPDVRTDLEATGDPFDPGDLRVARSAAESQRLNEPGRPCVIVSASGMATGGRVVHHLEHLLPRRDSCVLLVGYQAVGTRGRDLAEGARHLKMHGRYLPVRAEIVGLPHLSVHADADELVGWLCRLPAVPEVCYAVHGDPAASAALAGRLTDAGWCAVVPEPFERVRLD